MDMPLCYYTWCPNYTVCTYIGTEFTLYYLNPYSLSSTTATHKAMFNNRKLRRATK